MTIKEGYKVEMKPSQPANARVVQTADGFRCYITHLKIIEPLFDILDLKNQLLFILQNLLNTYQS